MHANRAIALVVAAALVAGCAPAVDPEPAGTIIPGDANGDGRFDISDPVFVSRHLLDGGVAPPCDAAIDVVPDGLVEVGDGLSLLGTLFSALPYIPPIADGACDGAGALSTAPSGRLRWGFTGATLTLQTLDLPVDAWSVGVQASGCTIAAATTLGTVAADRFDGGTRALGYENTRVTAEGAVSAVILGWNAPVRLEPRREAYEVLALTLTQGDSCTCELSLTDALSGDGQPVATVTSAGGRTYVPALVSEKVNACK